MMSFYTSYSYYNTKFRKIDLSKESVESCKNIYEDLNNQLLSKWYIPVENDFMVMTYFGILKKRLNPEQLNSVLQFESKTGAQINAFIKLKNELFNHAEIEKAIKNYNPNKFEEQIQKLPDIKNQLDDYFIEYGGRFANELKLESADIENNTNEYFKLLNLYANYNPTEKINKQTVRYDWLTNFFIKQFKKYATAREELRLLRSNCFSMIRKIINQIAKIYVEDNLIKNPNDIFYLSINEVFCPNPDYKTKIEIIKKDYETYKKLLPPSYFSIYPGELPEINNELETKTHIIGRPCSTGKITGKVKVFNEYYFPENINFDIIVTRHTDPGWTTLLGLCKGLIVEHGGILSHAAIVSRELGIPSVIGIENATAIFKNNQTIELNGDTGEIKILNEK